MTRLPLRLAIAILTVAIAACASKPPSTPAQPEQQPPPKPAEVSPQYRAQLHTDLGIGYYERGQMEVALDELDQAIKLDPNNAKAHSMIALVYTVLREYSKAELSFQRALTLAPQDSDIRANWGWYLCTHDRPKESIAEFERAVANSLYKTPEVALANAGTCSAAIGDARTAEAYYRRALSIAPNNAMAAYGLARLMYRQGMLEPAREQMKIVLRQTTPAPSPDALYLGMCIERRLRDVPSETTLATQLRNRYPDSAEAKAIDTGACE